MENKTIEINFKEIQPVDLMGNPIPYLNLHETISNVIYKNANSIRIGDVVRQLFYGKSVEVDEQVLEGLIIEVNGLFVPIIQTAILTYLSEKLNNLKQE